MANTKTRSDGGSGGKRGHSAMEHWQPTAEAKESARNARRQEDRAVAHDVDLMRWEDEGGFAMAT